MIDINENMHKIMNLDCFFYSSCVNFMSFVVESAARNFQFLCVKKGNRENDGKWARKNQWRQGYVTLTSYLFDKGGLQYLYIM